MNQIPKNCIEKFIKSYNNYPSIIELKLNSEDIDKLMKQACKFPMGPFEIISLVGVDTVVAVFQNLKLEVDSKFISALNE